MKNILKDFSSLADFEGQPGYVYLATDDRWFKIGFSKDPWHLSQGRKTANPTYKLLKEWAVFDMAQVESRTHSIFNSSLKEGTKEWFSLDTETVSFLTQLDDWAFAQFTDSGGTGSISEFKKGKAWERITIQKTYTHFFILNPYVLLQFFSRGDFPTRKQIFHLFDNRPMLFLESCRPLIWLHFKNGGVLAIFDHLETRRVRDGARCVAESFNTLLENAAGNS